jgi:hypothetical protein
MKAWIIIRWRDILVYEGTTGKVYLSQQDAQDAADYCIANCSCGDEYEVQEMVLVGDIHNAV